MRQVTVIGVLCAIAGSFVWWNTWSLKSDPKAKEAVLVLKKLEARIKTGISRRDYSVAVGEANFSVTQFFETGKTSSVPDFSTSHRNAINPHYS
jgi:hypothetical protein